MNSEKYIKKRYNREEKRILIMFKLFKKKEKIKREDIKVNIR